MQTVNQNTHYRKFTRFYLLLLLGLFTRLSIYAQDSFPKGWFKVGGRQSSYSITIDETTKHSGKASAQMKFSGEQANGFSGIGQNLQATSYRGKRVRISAWIKTDEEARAQIWCGVYTAKNMAAFDNMDSRPVKGKTDWQQYSVVLDVPPESLMLNFGVMTMGKGTVWTDDVKVEVVGNDVPSTDSATPEQKKEERTYLSQEYPTTLVNADFEAGANPIRKPVAVDPKVFDALTGTYAIGEGLLYVTKENGQLMVQPVGSKKQVAQALAENEYFWQEMPGSILFVKDNQGKVNEIVFQFPAGKTTGKRLDVATAKAYGAQLMTAAYQARGGLDKLKQIHSVWHDRTGTLPNGKATEGETYVADTPAYYFETREVDTKAITSQSASNGKTRWSSDGKTVRESSPAEIEGALKNLQLIWLEVALLPLPGQTLEPLALDDATYDNKPVDVVGALIGNDLYRLFFDKQTHHLVRITFGNETAYYDYAYDDYRPVGGVKFAHWARLTSANGTSRIVKIGQFKVNAGIDPKKLIKP